MTPRTTPTGSLLSAEQQAKGAHVWTRSERLFSAWLCGACIVLADGWFGSWAAVGTWTFFGVLALACALYERGISRGAKVNV